VEAPSFSLTPVLKSAAANFFSRRQGNFKTQKLFLCRAVVRQKLMYYKEIYHDWRFF